MKPLENRFLQFSKDVIGLCKQLTPNVISRSLISQLVRAATSIGANYAESQSGVSSKDFRHKVSIAKKESQETQYWLQLLGECYPERNDDFMALLDEAEQISKILQTILNKTKST